MAESLVSEMSARLMPLSRNESRHCSVYGLCRSWPSAVYYCRLQSSADISAIYISFMYVLYRYHCREVKQPTVLLKTQIVLMDNVQCLADTRTNNQFTCQNYFRFIASTKRSHVVVVNVFMRYLPHTMFAK